MVGRCALCSLSLSLSLHLPIHNLNRIKKLLLGKYPFLHKQFGEGFLLNYLGHEKFFKKNDLFGVSVAKM